MIFCGNKILVDGTNYKFNAERLTGLEIINTSLELPEAWRNLPVWYDVKEPVTLRDSEKLIYLRELWHVSGSKAFSEASCAWQFASWFRNSHYCSHCGGKLIPHGYDYGRECENCKAVFYAPISPAVITAVENKGKLLLAHNLAWDEERYSVIAGFVEPGETLEEAVKREIREEVSISVKSIKYFGSQTWPFPNSLMIGFTAEYESGDITPDGREITKAGFFSADEIRKMNIPDKASIARKLIDSFLSTH